MTAATCNSSRVVSSRPRQSTLDDLLEQRWYAHPVQVRELPTSPFLPQHVRFLQRAQELARVERIPLGVVFQVPLQSVLIRLVQLIALLDQRSVAVFVELPHVKSLGSGFTDQEGAALERMATVQLIRTIGGQ